MVIFNIKKFIHDILAAEYSSCIYIQLTFFINVKRQNRWIIINTHRILEI